MNWRIWSGSPSFVCHLHIYAPSKQKVLVPLREQGQKVDFCGTTLFAVKTATSVRCQHTGCPLTLAMRQKILRYSPFPPALGGPFAAPLFAPLSAMRNSLWMRLQLYFRFLGLPYDEMVILQFCPFVKYKNSPPTEIKTSPGTMLFSG